MINSILRTSENYYHQENSDEQILMKEIIVKNKGLFCKSKFKNILFGKQFCDSNLY